MSRRWRPAYIGIGSNLGEPVTHVTRAFDDIDAIADTRLEARSSLYTSAPVGPGGQPDFVNAAAAVITRLDPHALFDALAAIEDAHGRQRDGERWGPRTLDLDLLVFARERIDTSRLRVPHPRVAERNFVLLPLMDIAPHLEIPGLGSVASLLAALPAEAPRIERIGA